MIRDFCVVYHREKRSVEWRSGAPIVDDGDETIASGACPATDLLRLYRTQGDSFGIDLPEETCFAIWDGKSRSLIFGGDYTGLRSLYVRESPETIAVSSRIALLEPREFDSEGLGGFLYGTPFGNATCFRGISVFRPRRLALLRDGELRMRGFSWPEPLPPAECRSRLDEAVRARRPDGPFGCALSGGLDSALVLALAGPEARAFILAPTRPDYSEVAQAQKTADLLGATPTLVPVDEDALVRNLPAAVAAIEAPLLNLHAVSKLLLARAVRSSGLEVLLGGEGADEVFGEHLPTSPDLDLAPVVASRFTLKPPNPVYAADVDPPGRIPWSPFHHLVLRMVDGASRSAGVEARLPFLDQQVRRIGRGLTSEQSRNKQALRETAREILPAEIADRPKRPMLAPPVDFFSQYLRDEAIERCGVFKTREVHELYARFKKTPDDPRLDRAMMRIVTTLLLYERLIAPCAG